MHSREEAAAQKGAAGTLTPSSTVRALSRVDLTRAKRFHLPEKKNFEPQYANVYFSRLKSLGPVVLNSAKSIFGEPVEGKLQYAKRIVDVSSQGDVETVIVGVIFRHMPSKPSILAQYEAPSHELIPAPPSRSHNSYVGDDDSVFVEDEYGRCALDLSGLDSANVDLPFTTGFVLALRGVEQSTTGAFKVNAFASAGQAPQPPLPALANDKYLCIVSGLSFGKAGGDGLSVELLLEFFRGNSGDESEETASAEVVKLIAAGNIVARLEETENGAAAVTAAHRPVKSGEKERVATPIVEADRFLSAVASTLPVAVMPGEADPANYLLPQQSFHPCLLPSSSRNANLSRVTNPFECSLDERLVLGTSGQPVADFALYERREVGSNAQAEEAASELSGEKVLDILELMLSNRHIAPTCPDTLASYPFADGIDPFVVESTPHIFFAGNQNEFASRLVRAPRTDSQTSSGGSGEMDIAQGGEKLVQLVSVPRFDSTGQIVLVNLKTLDCTVREFALTM